jgi:transposase-like protein
VSAEVEIRCPWCNGAKVRRVTVAGKSWFYCGNCERDFVAKPAKPTTTKKNGVRR